MIVSTKWALPMLASIVMLAHSGVVSDAWIMAGKVAFGGLPCNASDTRTFECVEAPNAPAQTECGSRSIIDTDLNQQHWDVRGDLQWICTASQCVNEQKFVVYTGFCAVQGGSN